MTTLELTLRDVLCYFVPGAFVLVIVFGMPLPGNPSVPPNWQWLGESSVLGWLLAGVLLAYVVGHMLHIAAEIGYYALRGPLRWESPRKCLLRASAEEPSGSKALRQSLFCYLIASTTASPFTEAYKAALRRELAEHLPDPSLLDEDQSAVWEFCYNAVEMAHEGGLPTTLVRVQILQFMYRNWLVAAVIVFLTAAVSARIIAGVMALTAAALLLRAWLHYVRVYAADVYSYWYAMRKGD